MEFTRAQEYLRESGAMESIMDRDPSDEEKQILHAAMGVATEAGEIIDLLKRSFFYGKDYDRTDLALEVGDVLWYLAVICRVNGWTFEEIMDMNIGKLRARYGGDTFDRIKAIMRDEAAEREGAGV